MIAETSLRRTIDVEGCRLNLTITTGEPYRIELNYHYEVAEASQAVKLMENTYVKNWQHGLNLLKTVYDLTLDEEASNDEK